MPPTLPNLLLSSTPAASSSFNRSRSNGSCTFHIWTGLSIAHPYLLADNRHYTFYIWRKVIQAHWSWRYLLVPLYLYSWFSLTTALGKAQKKVWVLLLFFASALVLIPPPLIDFRYYTIPLCFLFLNSQIEENMNLALIGIMYTSVNIITMLVFLLRPFQWHRELGMQRFTW